MEILTQGNNRLHLDQDGKLVFKDGSNTLASSTLIKDRSWYNLNDIPSSQLQRTHICIFRTQDSLSLWLNGKKENEVKNPTPLEPESLKSPLVLGSEKFFGLLQEVVVGKDISPVETILDKKPRYPPGTTIFLRKSYRIPTPTPTPTHLQILLLFQCSIHSL